MADGVIVSNTHGNILAVNKSAQKVLGSCSDIVKGKPIRSVFTALRNLPHKHANMHFRGQEMKDHKPAGMMRVIR